MPYRLFALSNFGSMLGLISFPFLVEPTLASRVQAYSWSGVYVAFALLCGLTAWVSRDAESVPDEAKPAEAAKALPAVAAETGEMVLWVSLAACASMLLVAITNHLSQNVAPIPLLWVIPLALYLLSFILSFESDRIYIRWIFIPAARAASRRTWRATCSRLGKYAHQDHHSRFCRRSVFLLHGVPRRAGPAEARAPVPDAVLHDGQLGRRSGRVVCRPGGSACVQDVSGVADWLGSLRAAGGDRAMGREHSQARSLADAAGSVCRPGRAGRISGAASV